MANSANNRYQGLDPDLAKELISYEHSYFKEDRPIPFCGLNIYPVTMHEYEKFFMCVDCFTLDKNETPQGIRMTNLDYLIGIHGRFSTSYSGTQGETITLSNYTDCKTEIK